MIQCLFVGLGVNYQLHVEFRSDAHVEASFAWLLRRNTIFRACVKIIVDGAAKISFKLFHAAAFVRDEALYAEQFSKEDLVCS